MKNTLRAGFARVDITPRLGIKMAGYYEERIADGVLDQLQANAVALSDGKNTVIIVSIDHCGLKQFYIKKYKKYSSETLGIPKDAIFIHTTHIHTGPEMLSYEFNGDIMQLSEKDRFSEEYSDFLCYRIADVVKMAIDDMKPAKMGYGTSVAPNIAFIRRYKMKDGTTVTNPGINNPDVVQPIGEVDERVNVIRFKRESADDIVLVNFGNHPDTVGGNKFSADWPGFLRNTLEKAIDGVKCVFLNGAQGDVNHVKVNPIEGDFNDMFLDFDNVMRGYGHARYMGRVVAGAVMQVFDKVKFVDVVTVKYAEKIINVPANLPLPEEIPLAHKYYDLYVSGRENEIPFNAMALTTAVANAERIVSLENGPESFEMTLSALRVGDVGFIGIPGEPFTEIGKALKRTEGFGLILPCCKTNGSEGYFPTTDAYLEGGYEACASNFKAGVAELLIREGKDLLNTLK